MRCAHIERNTWASYNNMKRRVKLVMPAKAHRRMICMECLLVGENIDIRGCGMSFCEQGQRVDVTAVFVCCFIGAVIYYASWDFFGIDHYPGAVCSPQRGLFDSAWYGRVVVMPWLPIDLRPCSP